jgi:PIN domain nuclease of toxin-antitoxin system
VKHQTGKLALAIDLDRIVDMIERQPTWSLLGVEMRHLRSLASMPRFGDHRDPFDRLLIAQAISEGLDIITADLQFGRYRVNVVW